jgi:hypothetical protein
MRAKEDMSGLEGILGYTIVLFEQIHDPRGIAMLQAVTVRAIPHQLAIVQLPQLVNLPVDDSIVL